MVVWFLGLEDVLEIDKHFVELMVVGELLEDDTICNEKVLHKIVNVVERDNTVRDARRVSYQGTWIWKPSMH
uniref:Uncharacterized protein n=1 Tax=Tanacetum cinerariifolium TaxID=118510 RepID=A0A6L2JHJ7_TANCI|nr:hypothetical protein [Tanacetum cinerariifolium]